MDIKIGIPRGLFYYYYDNLWINFFDALNIKVVISPKTNKEIIKLGSQYSNDEMCLSIKTYLGHVAYLQDKCDYILIPRIDNYGNLEQTCTNFLAMFDYINNMMDCKILNYNVDINNHKTEKKGLISIAKMLGINEHKASIAYSIAKIKSTKIDKNNNIINNNKLNSNNLKVLLVSHPYNTHDEFIGKPIIKMLEKMHVEVIYSDKFSNSIKESKKLSNNLYWKYSREAIGSIVLSQDKLDGIVFFSTFPCGLDSLVNELVMRKLKIPYLNLVIDDLDSLSGMETRIESFIDILEQKIQISKITS